LRSVSESGEEFFWSTTLSNWTPFCDLQHAPGNEFKFTFFPTAAERVLSAATHGRPASAQLQQFKIHFWISFVLTAAAAAAAESSIFI
jgi:hypothetical protein